MQVLDDLEDKKRPGGELLSSNFQLDVSEGPAMSLLDLGCRELHRHRQERI